MRYVILSFLCAATVIAYVQRQGFSASTKMIEKDLALEPKDIGTVMGVWFLGYAFAQLPAGWVADRLGSRVALVLFAFAWSILTAVTGLATGYAGLIALWGLMGCVQAGLFPCATKAIGSTFPKANQAFASGCLVACMALGSAVSHFAAGQLIRSGQWNWQQLLALYAVPGVGWAVLFALFVPRWNDRIEERRADEYEPVPWVKLATDTQMQLLCAQQFFRASAVAFYYTWLPRYLQESFGLTEADAAGRAFLPPLFGIPGGLLGGLLSDYLLQETGSARLARQGMAAVGMALSAAGGLAALLATTPDVVIALLTGVMFFAVASGVSGYSLAIAYGGRRVATVFGVMNMCGNLGAGLFPLLVGWLATATGNWNLTLLVFTAFFAASGICFVFLKPRGTLFDVGPPTELSL